MKFLSSYLIFIFTISSFVNADLVDSNKNLVVTTTNFEVEAAIPTIKPTTYSCTLTQNYTYVGCYADGGHGFPRAMEKQFRGVRFNPQTCYAAAKAANYNYFALQFGGECWATNSLLMATQQYGPSTQCTMNCFNQTKQFPGNCGGKLANAVYLINRCKSYVPLCNTTQSYIG